MGNKGQGGKQPGAGRPKGSYGPEKKAEVLIRQEIKKFVADRIPQLLEAAYDSAKGHWALDKSDADGTRVYEVSPNPKSIFGLIEHAAGKATETVELSGKDGGPVQFEGFDFIKPQKPHESGDQTDA